jgi:hypothetical protein
VQLEHIVEEEEVADKPVDEGQSAESRHGSHWQNIVVADAGAGQPEEIVVGMLAVEDSFWFENNKNKCEFLDKQQPQFIYIFK